MPFQPVRLLAVAVAAATLALAGCSADAAPSTDETAGAADDGAFPVTLTDALGEATIDSKPERIVTIGWAAQDVVAALGTTPVATTDFTWGSVDKYLPWFQERVEELGGELPEIVRTTDAEEIDFDQVLSLEPDLILAPHSGITENEYKRLSDIAPTVAYAEAPWTSDWQELTRTIGKALGQVDDAEALIEATNAEITAQADAHPEFAGVPFTYGWYLSDGATAVDLYVPQDPRVQLMEQLGFVSSPQVVALGKVTEGFFGSVSLEELSSVESQFHLGWVNEPGDVARTVENPIVAAWGPIKNGSYYFMEDQSMAWASSQPSVLSIPWSLDTIVPEIAAHLHVTDS
ncbi:ABC transporter substrate-binding protein [Cellulomonas sp. URHE0023]|uniref:ABC transporter substrate-binding protein n=1 Tax=Cellulomonas sp. URHE0023 TaxID=1380354 RepID=UPI00047F8348|nr:ABC transporter substrate-binding protein [Cellulomonas sp. URHE0023]